MENTIYITDEKGIEYEMNILFTFENNEKKYVIVYPNDNQDDLYAFTYDLDGNLQAVEDEEEMSMIDEVIAAFDEENAHVS